MILYTHMSLELLWNVLMGFFNNSFLKFLFILQIIQRSTIISYYWSLSISHHSQNPACLYKVPLMLPMSKMPGSNSQDIGFRHKAWSNTMQDPKMYGYPCEKEQSWMSKKVDSWTWHNYYKCIDQKNPWAWICNTYLGMYCSVYMLVRISHLFRMHFQNNLAHTDLSFILYLHHICSMSVRGLEVCIHASHASFVCSWWWWHPNFKWAVCQCLTLDFPQSLNCLSVRYCQVPTFGCGTIQKFNNNASAMKKMAGQDFEDLLQVRACPNNNGTSFNWINKVCYTHVWGHFPTTAWQDHSGTPVWAGNMAWVG